MSDATRLVDALGTWCPVPIRLLARAIAPLPEGAVVDLVADDPLIAVDLPAWCETVGHELVRVSVEGERYTCRVRRGPS